MILSIVLILIFIIPTQKAMASNKDYIISKLEINAQLHPDGIMDVIESRTYKFNGSFKYAYRDLLRKGGVQYSNFSVSENGVVYQHSETGEPGTYQIIEKDSAVKVRWHFRAKDESRTFNFHYSVIDAIIKYGSYAF